MGVLSFLKAYSFHIIALTLFLVVTLYKFFPKTIQIPTVPGPSQTSLPNIYIDLSGAVEKPGVYEMVPTSRVGDLIEKGGGFSKNASPLWVSRNMNLAKSLTDGQKIYIPFEWETQEDGKCLITSLLLDIPTSPNRQTTGAPPTQTEGFPSGTTNVNTATLEELDALSGIGPVYAQKIIDNRSYANVTELIEKSGLSESTINKISTQISF